MDQPVINKGHAKEKKRALSNELNIKGINQSWKFTLTDKFITNLSNYHEANITPTKLRKQKENNDREFN
jgi:hypothetical protein